MPRRETPPPKDFAIDLTADWRAHAAIPEGGLASDGWVLYGTVRKRGQAFGLAWRRGMTAACTEQGQILTMSTLERSRISCAVMFDKVPGWEGIPKPTGDHFFGSGTLFSK